VGLMKVTDTAASLVPTLAVGATCVGEGVSFDCAVGLASRSVTFPVRRLVDQVVPRYVVDEELAAFTLLLASGSPGSSQRPGARKRPAGKDPRR